MSVFELKLGDIHEVVLPQYKWSKSDWRETLKEALETLGMQSLVELFVDMLFNPNLSILVNCLVYKYSGGRPPFCGWYLISEEEERFKASETIFKAVSLVERWKNPAAKRGVTINVMERLTNEEIPYKYCVDNVNRRWYTFTEQSTIYNVFEGHPNRFLCIKRPFFGCD